MVALEKKGPSTSRPSAFSTTRRAVAMAMRQLRDIDVAFIPMNLPFTMTVEQAADAVREFKPKIVYPYHSRGSDLDEFTRLVGTDVGVEVRVRQWY
jgi:L-ascorbate metabolism protein UlaG (beta-lactamase superfamily)